MACARYELDQDLVPNKVHVDSNMFGSLMMHRIRENIDCFCHGTILDFGTGADDGGLPFARSRVSGQPPNQHRNTQRALKKNARDENHDAQYF